MGCVRGLVVVSLLASIEIATGHGYLMGPPPRNMVEGGRNGNCPHCGNGHGVCGDGNQWPSGSNYVGRPGAPVMTFEPGSIVQLNVSMNVNHMGHSEFFICDKAIDSEDGAIECLQQWPLLRVPPEEVYNDCIPNDPREDCQPIDPNFPGRWYHYPGMDYHHTRYRIPDDLECEHCTLQWFWPTANSAPFDSESYKCYAALLREMGWDFNFCGWTCGSRQSPTDCDLVDTPEPHSPDPAAGSGFEEFRNCADIAVLASGSPRPGPAPAVPTPSPATIEPQPTPEPEPEPEPNPEPEPTPEPSPAPPPAPTPAPGPESGCKATPGLNRGVQDSHCQRCLTGYKWWPCNEAILCTGCKPSLAAQSAGLRLRHQGSRVEDETSASALVQQNTELERSAHEAQLEL